MAKTSSCSLVDLCRRLQVFNVMMTQGVMPNEVTYSTAIVACWKGNVWRKGVELLNLMKFNNFPLNMITVSMVIDVCDRNKQFDLAVSEPIPPPNHNLHPLLSILEVNGLNSRRWLLVPHLYFLFHLVGCSWQSYVFDSNVVGSIRSENYDPRDTNNPGMVVDLHGYSLTMAKAAVRSGLKRLVTSSVHQKIKRLSSFNITVGPAY